MDKDMDNPSILESETEKKMKTPTIEENVDPKTSPSEPIVSDIIRQFKERSVSKSSKPLSKVKPISPTLQSFGKDASPSVANPRSQEDKF